MTGQSCLACRAFRPLQGGPADFDDAGNVLRGECRANPPSPVVFPVHAVEPVSGEARIVGFEVGSAWPTVVVDDECEEWREK
jgi:hypothetical protein